MVRWYRNARTTTPALIAFQMALFAALALVPVDRCVAASGTEGAAFLDIPVGAGPAAMGSAYTALANDSYAATYNPGGLGFIDSTQFSAQHLSYLESLHYEYLSFGIPLKHSGVGGSIQYLGSGDIDATEANGARL